MVFWFPLIIWALALVLAVAMSLRGPRRFSLGVLVDQLLRYIMLLPVGLQGLWAFTGHVFFAERTAASIGWATSPFQTEVGMANLGIGMAGLIGAFLGSPGFRAAVGVVAVGFLGGAGIGHAIQIEETGNLASGNAGPIFYTDFLTPLAVLGLLLVQRVLGPVPQR
ncbi:DUF6790 family protein [Ancylobacter sp.]|uniref:DUF6790 family protein n=1 Tax=Ancylobacter sp. TaxID=1872567 RepID=UPI003D0DDC99